MIKLEEIEKKCGYTFKDKELLRKAFTLSSYDGSFNNESLECLGDALLSLIVAEKYYALGYTEGEITEMKQQLVSDEALRPVSERLGFSEALIRDKGDSKNKKAVPSAYEAFCAAIYLDGGIEEARKFALATLTPLSREKNTVSELQEYLQARGEQPPPYEKITLGTPQNPILKVEVTVRGKTFAAEGASFSEAKKIAAGKALEFIKDGE